MHGGGDIQRSVILPNVEVGQGRRLKNVILDRGVRIPDRLVVGEDPRRRSTVQANGDRCLLITQAMLDGLSA